MPTTLKQLGQLRPANTTAAPLYSPATGVTAVVKSIVVCNTSGAAAKFRIFNDDSATDRDETTALFWDVLIAADTTVQIDVFLAMIVAAGELAVRTNTSNALTFTAWGVEQT